MKDGFRTISEASQNLYCSKCAQNGGIFIELQCQHVYCMMCASFLYSKCRKQYVNQAAMKCSVCNTVSILSNDSVNLIKTTIRNQILPSMDSQSINTENKLTVSKNTQCAHYIGAISRKIKSEQHSFENVTPSTTKCFFSKCQSPSLRKKQQKNGHSINNFCHIHPMQPISYICFTCQCQSLCIKCITFNKKHINHQIKQISKAISQISQQLSLNKLQLSYKIDQAQLYQKRIDDHYTLIKDRSTKTITQIQQQFASIYKKIKQKQLQITNQCRNNFSITLQQIQQQALQIKKHIQILKNSKNQINSIKKQQKINSAEFLNKFIEFKQHNYQNQNNYNLFNGHSNSNMLHIPTNSIYKQIKDVLEKINSLDINFKKTSLSRVGTISPFVELEVQIENCRSQNHSKPKRKQSSKRLKTNFVSLNSSRQKNKKKYTKTEQDQRRQHKLNNNSHRNHQKEGSNRKNNDKVPSYITDFINKKSSKLNSEAGSYIREMTSNIPHNYTKVTKLSKTISPEELIKKKRQHKAVIKQRLQIRKKTTKN